MPCEKPPCKLLPFSPDMVYIRSLIGASARPGDFLSQNEAGAGHVVDDLVLGAAIFARCCEAAATARQVAPAVCEVTLRGCEVALRGCEVALRGCEVALRRGEVALRSEHEDVCFAWACKKFEATLLDAK